MLAFAATIAALLTRARVAQRTPVPGVAACGEREVELEFNYSAWLLCNFDGSNCKPLSATPVGGGFYRICVPWGMSIKPLDYPWCCKVFRKTGWSPSRTLNLFLIALSGNARMRTLALALVVLAALTLLPPATPPLSAGNKLPLAVTLSVKVNGREVYRNYPSFTLNTLASFYTMILGQLYANGTAEKLYATGQFASTPNVWYAWTGYEPLGSRNAPTSTGTGWYPLEARIAIGDGVPWFYDQATGDYKPVGALPFWELGFLGHALANASATATRGSNSSHAWLTYSSTFTASAPMRVSEVGLYAAALYSSAPSRVNALLFYHMIVPPIQLREGDKLTVEFTVTVGEPLTAHLLDWWLAFLPPSTPLTLSVNTRDGAAKLCRNPQWLTGAQSVRDAVLYYDEYGRPVVSQGLPVLELGASGDPWDLNDTGVHSPISAAIRESASTPQRDVSSIVLEPVTAVASANRLTLIYYVYINSTATVRELSLMIPTVECSDTSSPPTVRRVAVLRLPLASPLSAPGGFAFEVSVEWGFGSVHAGASEPLGAAVSVEAYKVDTSARTARATVRFKDRLGREFPLGGNMTVPALTFAASNLTTLRDWSLERLYTSSFSVAARRDEYNRGLERVVLSAPDLPPGTPVSRYNAPLPASHGSFRLLSHPVTGSAFAFKFTNAQAYDGSQINMSGYVIYEYAALEWTYEGQCTGPCHRDVYKRFIHDNLPDPHAPLQVPPTNLSPSASQSTPAPPRCSATARGPTPTQTATSPWTPRRPARSSSRSPATAPTSPRPRPSPRPPRRTSRGDPRRRWTSGSSWCSSR